MYNTLYYIPISYYTYIVHGIHTYIYINAYSVYNSGKVVILFIDLITLTINGGRI
jgi:hypothetical protein